MSGSTHLIIPDAHAHYEHDNRRADYLAKLIIDLRPDVVVNMGDSADMPSLCGYDRGTRSFHGRSYKKDIESHLDFQERIWSPVKQSKKRLPDRYVLIGNHEHRITRAIDLQPELDGAISMDDLELERYYNEVTPYEGATPGVLRLDGVCYAHYFVSGVMGRPIGGLHHAASLLTKQFVTCTASHSHLADWCVRARVDAPASLSAILLS